MTDETTPLPPCGLYRTTKELAGVPAGRLVSFHNHGDPGPGVYLPASWTLNKATFQEKGHTLPEPWEESAKTLQAVPVEGFYRVLESFYCCSNKCKLFEPDLLVQLGYNGEGNPILFVPELTPNGLALPEVGTGTDLGTLSALTEVKVQKRSQPSGARPRHTGDLH